MVKRAVFLWGWAALLGAGCVQEEQTLDEAKGQEEDLDALVALEQPGKADSQRRPTENGVLRPGIVASAELAPEARYHRWTFSLTGEARVGVQTQAQGFEAEVDTVLYLYRVNPSGSQRQLARNDDFGGTFWSRVERTLGAGEYSVLVKGYSRQDLGPFDVALSCEGAGCPQTPRGQCVFGSDMQAIESGAFVQVVGRSTLTVETPRADWEERHLVAALHASTHTDVQTAEEAFGRVDGGQIEKLFLWDEVGRRFFLGYTYGAGDNTYGAIFPHISNAPTDRAAAWIQDSDLQRCAVFGEACLLPADFRALLQDARWEVVSDSTIQSAQGLDPAVGQQVLAAVREAYEEVQDLDGALAAVDQGGVRRVELVQRDGGRRVVAYEYGAGGNSYGALYKAEGLERAARIEDGSLTACDLFEARSVGEACGAPEECATGLCQTYEEGPFCFRTACVAPCRTSEECVAVALYEGADPRDAEGLRCGDGKCEHIPNNTGALACE